LFVNNSACYFIKNCCSWLSVRPTYICNTFCIAQYLEGVATRWDRCKDVLLCAYTKATIKVCGTFTATVFLRIHETVMCDGANDEGMPHTVYTGVFCGNETLNWGIPFMFRDDNLKSYAGAATKDKQVVSRAMSTHYPAKSPHPVT